VTSTLDRQTTDRQTTAPDFSTLPIPRTEADVAIAEEQQDYVSYVWKYDNPGFLILNALLKDALIKRTGIVKWWTEREAEIVEQRYTNLSLEQRQFVHELARHIRFEDLGK